MFVPAAQRIRGLSLALREGLDIDVGMSQLILCFEGVPNIRQFSVVSQIRHRFSLFVRVLLPRTRSIVEVKAAGELDVQIYKSSRAPWDSSRAEIFACFFVLFMWLD